MLICLKNKIYWKMREQRKQFGLDPLILVIHIIRDKQFKPDSKWKNVVSTNYLLDLSMAEKFNRKQMDKVFTCLSNMKTRKALILLLDLWRKEE